MVGTSYNAELPCDTGLRPPSAEFAKDVDRETFDEPGIVTFAVVGAAAEEEVLAITCACMVRTDRRRVARQAERPCLRGSLIAAT